jgi:hypothetical protein
VFNSDVESWSLNNNLSSRAKDDDEGRKELQKFLTRTLEHLIQIEKGKQARPLSLEYVARLDVGIMPHRKGELEACYFFNEVTRAPDMTWWAQDKGRLLRFWSPVEYALLAMVKWHQRRYLDPI